MGFAADLHEYLVQVPAPLDDLPHGTTSPFADHPCKEGAKPIAPQPDVFMTDIDAALIEQIFDVTQRQRETNVHRHRKLNDISRCLELTKGRSDHWQTLR